MPNVTVQVELSDEDVQRIASQVKALLAAESPPPAPTKSDEWMTTKQHAKYRGCSFQHIERERVRGSGPPYTKDGTMVRYRKSDIDAYLATCRRRHTADTGPEPKRPRKGKA